MKKLFILLVMLMLSGCNTVISSNNNEVSDAYNLSFNEASNSEYSINGSTYIELGKEDINITKGGTYILEGTLENASIIVNVAKTQDVQLVLNGVTINSNDFAAIYIVEGDEITITLNEETINTLTDSGVYTQIDDNNVDAIIYSKADLFINGTGTLNITTNNHGIVSKDDLIITSGTYNIDAAGQGLKGKDCLKISDGIFNINSGKDALKSDNDTDSYRGYVYISGGTFLINSDADGIYGLNLVTIDGGNFEITTNKSSSATSYKAIKCNGDIEINDGSFVINSADDGIHSDSNVTINNGTFTINSTDDAIHGDEKVTIENGIIDINGYEGIESTYVLINDGTINIYAKDDGINAGQKTTVYTPTVEINGGTLTITMAQGDTDGVDSNGYIYVNGGVVNITGQSAFDYDLKAEHNGGTIIVNGYETETIENQLMGAMNQGAFGNRPDFNGYKSFDEDFGLFKTPKGGN